MKRLHFGLAALCLTATAFAAEPFDDKFRQLEELLPSANQYRTGEVGAPGINGGLLPRRGPRPDDGASVNAFVCTVDVEDLDQSLARLKELKGTVAVPRMPIPGVGWLAYAKDPDGNIFGMMQTDEIGRASCRERV